MLNLLSQAVYGRTTPNHLSGPKPREAIELKLRSVQGVGGDVDVVGLCPGLLADQLGMQQRAGLRTSFERIHTRPCHAGHFGNSFRDLIGASGYELTAPVEAGPKQCTFVADVQGTNGVTAVRFEMVVKAIGGKKGCWMTRSLLRV